MPVLAPAAPADVGGRRADSRLIWLAYAAIAAFLVAYLVSLIVRPATHVVPWLDGGVVPGFEALASLLCILRGVVRRQGRPVALLLGFAMLSWSLGDISFSLELTGAGRPPDPSIADAFWLSFFPLAYVAVILFARSQVGHRLAAPNWLDGAVAGLGASSLCAAFALHDVSHLTGGPALAAAANLAYPVGDLVLLVLVVGASVVMAGRRRAPWVMLAGGMAINVAGDTFRLFSMSSAPSHVGAVVDGMAWPTAILLMSAALWLRPGRWHAVTQQRSNGFALPGLAAAGGLAILYLAAKQLVSGTAIELAAATLLLVGARLAVSVRAMRSLTAERHRMSVTDPLTGLGNRRHLFEVLDGFFSAGGDAARHSRLAFLFVDLNRFKEVNDSFGHPAGDEILRQLGARLSGALRGSDVLVRLGGDEFAVVLEDADADYATKIARRVAASLDEPFVLDAVNARIGASIGIALAPADAKDAASLVWCADVAMYRAKLSGEPLALYEPALDDGANRLQLAEELRCAVTAGELVLHFQPQLDLRSGRIDAVEALVRWPHPRLGLIPPLRFLSLAEEADLMEPLTTWVLDNALAQCATWREQGHKIAVSVNVSAGNLLQDGFVELIESLLHRRRVPAVALVLEITETSIIADFERSRGVIERLRDLGVLVSIDDFGAGFTSLAYLSSLSVRELKLDRTLIAGLAGGARGLDVPLVRATIDLGHALGLRVVTEGIEDRATLELLTELGCDLAQGFFIGRPTPAGEVAFAPPAVALPALAA